MYLEKVASCKSRQTEMGAVRPPLGTKASSQGGGLGMFAEQTLHLDSRLTQGKPLPCSRPQIKKPAERGLFYLGAVRLELTNSKRGGIYSQSKFNP